MLTLVGDLSASLDKASVDSKQNDKLASGLTSQDEIESAKEIKQGSPFYCAITVEPVTFFYACAMILHTPVIQQYVYSRVAFSRGLIVSNYQSDASKCELALSTESNSYRESRNYVQAEASLVHLGIVLSASVPSIVMALLLGAWSDKVGRKVVMLLPIVGGLIDTTCILAVMYTNLPVYALFVGSFINGMRGFFTTMILAVFSYVADITDESKRALRLGILEAIAFISGMISHLTSGWWIKHLGFKSPYWLILSLHICNLLYVLLFLPETVKDAETKRLKDLFDKEHFYRIIHLFTNADLNKKWPLVGLMLASAFMMISSIGFGSVIVLYALDAPFCCSPIMIGYFLAESMLVQAIGAMLGFFILRKCISEMALTQIGFISIISSLLMLAFIKTNWLMFIVPLIGAFGGVCMPIIRARMSQLVVDHEQGALFAAVATVEIICTLIGAAVFNSLYSLTVQHFSFKGLCFLAMAMLMVVPSFIMGLISWHDRKIEAQKRTISIWNLSRTADDNQVDDRNLEKK